MIHVQFQLLYKHQEQLCSVQFSDTFNSLETNKKYLVSGHPFEILKPVLSSESLLEFVVLQAGFFPLLHLSDEEMLPFDLRTKGLEADTKDDFCLLAGDILRYSQYFAPS